MRPLNGGGPSATAVRFGPFIFDPQCSELYRDDLRLKLSGQAIDVLRILIAHHGELVTREELQRQLWPGEAFGDFEHGINAAVNRLREYLLDSAINPRYIETVPRHGYRFIAKLEPVSDPDPPPRPEESLSSAPTRTPLLLMLGLMFIALLAAAAVLVHRKPLPFQQFIVHQVTNSGNAVLAAISPDAQYVVSVEADHGLEGVWLRNIPTGSNTGLIHPSASRYYGIDFSPDGSFVYFRRAEPSDLNYKTLYRVPVLGGNVQKIIENIDSDIAFAPSGQRVAYVRANAPAVGQFQLASNSADGMDERTLAVGPIQNAPTVLAWSPNEKELYCSGDDIARGLEILDIRTGKSRPVDLSLHTRVVDLQWLSRAHGFLPWLRAPEGFLAIHHRRGRDGLRGQIGFAHEHGTGIVPVTQDANSYSSLSLSRDGRTLAAVMARSSATISVLSWNGAAYGEPRILLSQSNGLNEESAVDWNTSDELLVSNADRLTRLSLRDGAETQILAGSDTTIERASRCGENYIVLNWRFNNSLGNLDIWRVNADGSRPAKLLDGRNTCCTICSPDHRWVHYLDWVDRRYYRIPIEGAAKPELVTALQDGTFSFSAFSISPDGNALVTAVARAASPKIHFQLMDLQSQRPLQAVPANNYTGQLQFAPDGKSFAYSHRENGFDNLLLQPLDGSPARTITNFASDQIWSFAFAPDGKSLAVLRGHWDSDVVLLQETTR